MTSLRGDEEKLDKQLQKELEVFAAEIRLKTLEGVAAFGSGHIGGAMSIVETLAVLYGSQLAHDPAQPQWCERDRLVLSKGHAGPALYATLAIRGFFPIEMLQTINKPETKLPSHCDARKTPGIDMTTGSLGQGLSCGVGIAIGGKMDKLNYTTYVVVGDGEMDEGQNWEAIMCAAHNSLDNLILLYDKNNKQLDGRTCDIMKHQNPCKQLESFGWHAQGVDGHDVVAIWQAIETAKQMVGRPSAIVLDTIKGKGCTFSETVEKNHHQFFGKEEMEQAIAAAKVAVVQARGEGC